MNERSGPSKTTFWEDTDDTEALQHYRTLINTIDDGLRRGLAQHANQLDDGGDNGNSTPEIQGTEDTRYEDSTERGENPESMPI